MLSAVSINSESLSKSKTFSDIDYYLFGESEKGIEVMNGRRSGVPQQPRPGALVHG